MDAEGLKRRRICFSAEASPCSTDITRCHVSGLNQPLHGTAWGDEASANPSFRQGGLPHDVAHRIEGVKSQFCNVAASINTPHQIPPNISRTEKHGGSSSVRSHPGSASLSQPATEGSFLVRVKAHQLGEEVAVRLPGGSSSVEDLLQELHGITGIAVHRMRLLWGVNGQIRTLQKRRSLQDEAIPHGSLLHLVSCHRSDSMAHLWLMLENDFVRVVNHLLALLGPAPSDASNAAKENQLELATSSLTGIRSKRAKQDPKELLLSLQTAAGKFLTATQGSKDIASLVQVFRQVAAAHSLVDMLTSSSEVFAECASDIIRRFTTVPSSVKEAKVSLHYLPILLDLWTQMHRRIPSCHLYATQTHIGCAYDNCRSAIARHLRSIVSQNLQSTQQVIATCAKATPKLPSPPTLDDLVPLISEAASRLVAGLVSATSAAMSPPATSASTSAAAARPCSSAPDPSSFLTATDLDCFVSVLSFVLDASSFQPPQKGRGGEDAAAAALAPVAAAATSAATTTAGDVAAGRADEASDLRAVPRRESQGTMMMTSAGRPACENQIPRRSGPQETSSPESNRHRPREAAAQFCQGIECDLNASETTMVGSRRCGSSTQQTRYAAGEGRGASRMDMEASLLTSLPAECSSFCSKSSGTSSVRLESSLREEQMEGFGSLRGSQASWGEGLGRVEGMPAAAGTRRGGGGMDEGDDLLVEHLFAAVRQVLSQVETAMAALLPGAGAAGADGSSGNGGGSSRSSIGGRQVKAWDAAICDEDGGQNVKCIRSSEEKLRREAVNAAVAGSPAVDGSSLVELEVDWEVEVEIDKVEIDRVEIEGGVPHERKNEVENAIGDEVEMEVEVQKLPPKLRSQLGQIISANHSLASTHEAWDAEFWSFVSRQRHRLNAFFCSLPILMGEEFSFLLGRKDLLSSKSQQKWLQWAVPEPRDDFRDKSFVAIRRGEEALEDAMRQILDADPCVLRHGVDVRFVAEQAAGPGVLREFFALMAAQLFDPNFGLFQAAAADGQLFSLSAWARWNPDSSSLLRFCGRLLALALAHQVPLGVKFSAPLFRHLAGQTVSVADVAAVDPQLHSSCQKMLELQPEEVSSLDLCFCIESLDPFSPPHSVDLVPNGAAVPVDATNLDTYLQLLLKQRFIDSVAEQAEDLRAGFEELLQDGMSMRKLLEPLDPAVFNGLLYGEDADVAVSDWQAHTEYHGYSETDDQIQWFWTVAHEMTTMQRRRLLFFATAIWSLPSNGFSGLSTGFHLHRSEVGTDHLPTAHTCFHQLLLPPYSSLEMTRQRLLAVASEHVAQGFGFA